MVDLSKIIHTNGKAIFLAYDQGLEHGPTDVNDENVDPTFVLGIAKEGDYSAVILQKGIAQKYYTDRYRSVPLIVKLNGKTNLVAHTDPYSPQICSVLEAIELGASAVGYTIYVGSSYEPVIFSEFSKIEKEAHEKGLPVIAWMYLHGSGTKGKDVGEMTAYATRLGLELGADIVKIKYPGDLEALSWAVESAGLTKVVVSGGEKREEEEFLTTAREVMKSGAIGMAVGRNIWQNDNPMVITDKLKAIVYGEPVEP